MNHTRRDASRRLIKKQQSGRMAHLTYGISVISCTDCPQFCPANYAPVCDSDGKTWPNTCTYQAAVCFNGVTAKIVGPNKCQSSENGDDNPRPPSPPTIVLTDQSQSLGPIDSNPTGDDAQPAQRGKNNIPPPYQGKIPTVTIQEDVVVGRSLSRE